MLSSINVNEYESLPCAGRKKEQTPTAIYSRKCLNKMYKMSSIYARTRPPSNLQVVLHKRNQPRSVYYFTHGRKIKYGFPSYDSEKESPFHITRDKQDFSYRTEYKEDRKEMREKAKTYNYVNRPNHYSRLCEDKLERLHVSDTLITLPGRSIVDHVHPDFFKITTGRPIKEKFNISDYKSNLKELFLTRLEIGYKWDQIYLMEEQHVKEKKRLREIQEKFQFYSDCYDKFLAEDHSHSIILLKDADNQMKKSKMKSEKIRYLLRVCGWYRGKILILDEVWRRGRIFQKFLYRLSPLWWRNRYDYMNKMEESAEADPIIGKSKSSSLYAVHSIVTIIEEFKESIAQSEPPVLYFQNPIELLHIFYEMERSNLLALLQCEELTRPAQQMIYGLERAKAHFANEVKVLREQMKALEDEVIYEENRSRECEMKAKEITFGFFRDLIVDRFALNLFVNVEDCYETCVAPNDSNLSSAMMMKSIEHKQESLMVSLDNLPNDIVLKALANCYKEDAKMMREAKEATKMITQIENLISTLRKSLEPKKEGKPGRKALWRSEPPKEKMDMATPPNPLTKEQIEYLHFFTDFCPVRDDIEVCRQLCANKMGNITRKGL